MTDMKAKRILAVILSAAIFLCNVPVTALAEELKEPAIQETHVLEEEPIAGDVKVENQAESDDNISIENFATDDNTNEDNVTSPKADDTDQENKPVTEDLPKKSAGTNTKHPYGDNKINISKKSSEKEIIIEDLIQVRNLTLLNSSKSNFITLEQLPVGAKIKDLNTCWDGSPIVWQIFSKKTPELGKIKSKHLYAKRNFPYGYISNYVDKDASVLCSVNDLMLYEFPIEKGGYNDRAFCKWSNESNMNLINGTCFFDIISKTLKDSMKLLPSVVWEEHNDDGKYMEYDGMYLYVLPNILGSTAGQFGSDGQYGYKLGFKYYPPEHSLGNRALTSMLHRTWDQPYTTSGRREYHGGEGAFRPVISLDNNLILLPNPDSDGIYTVVPTEYCDAPTLYSSVDSVGRTMLHAVSDGASKLVLYKDGEKLVTTNSSTIVQQAVADGDYYVVAKNGDYEAKSNTINLTDVVSITPKITAIYNDSTATFAEQQTVSFRVEEEGAKTSSISSVTVVGNKTGNIPVTNKDSVYTFTTEENDSFTITAENTYGNSDTAVINVSKVDKDAPLLSVLPSTTTATNNPITLSITASDNGSGIKEITLPSGGKYAGDKTNFEVSTNGEYTVTATDNTDKEKTVSVNIGNLDFELPAIGVDISTTSTTKDNIIATVTASDNIAVDYIELPDGSKINATTASFTITSNGSFSFKVVDKAGNENTKTVTVDNVDKDGPTIVVVKSTEEYTNQPVTLSITATDINGVEKITLPDGTEVVGGTAEYVVEKNASLEISATDGLGSETKQEAIVDNIDTEPPQITLTPDTTEYVKDGVNVVITGSDNREVDKIVLEDGTEIKSGKTDIFVTENKTVKATVYDKAGNFENGSLEISNIDSTPPTLTYSYDDTVTKDNVEVTVTAKDDIGVKGIRLPNGVFVTSLKTTFIAEENGNYICTAIDHVGNETPKEVVISCVDRSAPTIEKINISPVGKMKGLFSGSDVTVSAVANDNVAVDRIEYRVVGVDSKFKPYTKPLLFDMEINTTVEFIAYDTVGNSSEKVTSDKIEVDKTKPTISYSVSTEDLTKGDVLITIEAKDNKAVKYIKLPNGELIEDNKTVFTATENSDYEFIAYDTVGNASEKLVVKVDYIDKELPTAKFIYDSTPTRESFEVTVKASDNKEVKSITLPDGTVVNNYTTKITVDSNGIYEVKIEDIVGNITKDSITINNFDFEKPVITSVKLGEAGLLTKLLTNKSVTLTVEATDDTGIATYEYKLVNTANEIFKDWTNLGSASGVIADKDFDGNVLVRVTDGVGNISDESTTAFTLDVTPPTLTYELSTNMPTENPVLVTFKASDNTAVKHIKLPNGKVVEGSTATYLVRDNGNYKASVTDTAENISTITAKISNIKGYGIPEEAPFLDLDKDGKNDMLLNPPFPDGDDFVDLDGDGKDDRKDLDNDGIVDWMDSNGDGSNDLESPWLDLDGDGKNDLLLPPNPNSDDLVDLNNDGIDDRKDIDGDGNVDYIDSNGDGINDYIDTDGDGKPDWIDANGDGKNDIEKIFIDLDGDGINDIIYNSTSSISVVAETDGAEVTIKSDTKTYVLVPTRILDEKDILEPDREYQTFVLNKDGSITNHDSAELIEDSTIKVLAAYKIAKEDTVADNEDTTSTENNPFGDRVCFKIIKEGTHELIVRDSNDNEKIVPVTVKFNEKSTSYSSGGSSGGSSHTEVLTKEVPVEIPIYIEKPVYVEKEKVVYVDKPVTEKPDTNSSPITEDQKVVSQASSSKVINTISWQIPIVLIIIAGAGGYFIGVKSKKRGN